MTTNALMLAAATGLFLTAKAQPAPPLDPQLQLMVTQPSIEVATNIEVTASFDPPAVRPGEKSTWRVTFNALDDSIQWPDKIMAPPGLELQFSARGQMLFPADNKLKAQTTINHRVRATTTGSFTIPEFEVEVYDHRVTVPAARLDVMADAAPEMAPSPQLLLEVSDTNIFAGQPVTVRALLPAATPGAVQMLTGVRLNGEGFLVDQGITRQTVTLLPGRGRSATTYLYETALTPLVTGALAVSAQGFIANQFNGPTIVPGRGTPGAAPLYLLLDSDTVTINVRPLPRAGELPGYTGAIGKFTSDPPQLSVSEARVGDLVKLVVTFRGEGSLARFVAPAPPVSSQWQVSAAVPGGVAVARPGNQPTESTATFDYSLIPLTKGIAATPAIPFSYFDPKRGAYVDLTIPSLPITVLPGAATVDSQVRASADALPAMEEKKLTLSALATTPGQTSQRLAPLQQRMGFVLVQLLPVLGFFGLWLWDRRRRFLEQHPDIVLRRRARRALHREKRALQNAFQTCDALGCATIAVRAMRVAGAPHYPAEPRALVCRDVLDLLPETGGGRETVRRFFAIADASQFSGAAADPNGLLALRSELDQVLETLEAKL